MRRLLFLACLPLVLSACGPATVSYKLTFDVADRAQRNDLTLRSMDVIERRLGNLGEKILDQQITPGDNDATINLTLSNKSVIEVLNQQLTQPFKMRIMKQVPEAPGTVNVQGQGSFAETGITEEDLVWADSAQDEKGKGVVKLTFTDEGTKKLVQLFRENQGNSIGIFVRDRLVSKLVVKADIAEPTIYIRDIPSPELARIFVDDLDVGLHVTFTPLP